MDTSEFFAIGILVLTCIGIIVGLCYILVPEHFRKSLEEIEREKESAEIRKKLLAKALIKQELKRREAKYLIAKTLEKIYKAQYENLAKKV